MGSKGIVVDQAQRDQAIKIAADYGLMRPIKWASGGRDVVDRINNRAWGVVEQFDQRLRYAVPPRRVLIRVVQTQVVYLELFVGPEGMNVHPIRAEYVLGDGWPSETGGGEALPYARHYDLRADNPNLATPTYSQESENLRWAEIIDLSRLQAGDGVAPSFITHEQRERAIEGGVPTSLRPRRHEQSEVPAPSNVPHRIDVREAESEETRPISINPENPFQRVGRLADRQRVLEGRQQLRELRLKNARHVVVRVTADVARAGFVGFDNVLRELRPTFVFLDYLKTVDDVPAVRDDATIVFDLMRLLSAQKLIGPVHAPVIVGLANIGPADRGRCRLLLAHAQGVVCSDREFDDFANDQSVARPSA